MTSNSVTGDPRLRGRAVKRIAFDEQAIAARVRELGAEITASYPDGELLVLGHMTHFGKFSTAL